MPRIKFKLVVLSLFVAAFIGTSTAFLININHGDVNFSSSTSMNSNMTSAYQKESISPPARPFDVTVTRQNASRPNANRVKLVGNTMVCVLSMAIKYLPAFFDKLERTKKIWQSSQLNVQPKECIVMIQNLYSTKSDAIDLTDFLNCRKIPSFSMATWDNRMAGQDRDKANEIGVLNCRYYVALMDRRWQLSGRCQFETKLLYERVKKGEAVIIPVLFPDFDPEYDVSNDQLWIFRCAPPLCPI